MSLLQAYQQHTCCKPKLVLLPLLPTMQAVSRAEVRLFRPAPPYAHLHTKLPAPQSVQAAHPAASLYLPATHCVHVPPAGPEDPALQVQLVWAGLPAVESESDGQEVHVELTCL